MLGIVIMRSLSVLLRSDPRNPRMRFPAWRWEETCGKRIDVPLSFQGQEVWSSMSPFYWAVLLEDLKCLGEETTVHIWLMRSFGNWAPRATEIIGSTCDHSSQSPAHVRKHSWVEERWITHWWLRGNLMCPTKCCEKLKDFFFKNQPIWRTSKR